MPRKVPFEQKQMWFEKFESGKTVARLASDHKKDPRTIQRGIEEARHRQLSNQVRTELLKAAIRKHQDDLMELVTRISGQINGLPVHVDSINATIEPDPGAVPGIVLATKEGLVTNIMLEAEGQLRWNLLREHLGSDKAYTHLGRWKSAVLLELNARSNLRERIRGKLTRELKLRIDTDFEEPGTITPAYLNELTKSVFSLVLSEHPAYRVKLVAGTQGEFFIDQGSTCGRLFPADVDGTLAALRKLPMSVAREESAAALVSLHQVTVDNARRASLAFEEISASYYLGGTCSSCKRYGL